MLLRDKVTNAGVEIGPTRPQHPSEQHTRYICPLYLHFIVREIGLCHWSDFICDMVGDTPVQATAKAAALGQVLVDWLRNARHRGDRQVFLEMFGDAARHAVKYLEANEQRPDPHQ